MTTHTQGGLARETPSGPVSDTQAKVCPVTGQVPCLCGYATTEPSGTHARGTLQGD